MCSHSNSNMPIHPARGRVNGVFEIAKILAPAAAESMLGYQAMAFYIVSFLGFRLQYHINGPNGLTGRLEVQPPEQTRPARRARRARRGSLLQPWGARQLDPWQRRERRRAAGRPPGRTGRMGINRRRAVGP